MLSLGWSPRSVRLNNIWDKLQKSTYDDIPGFHAANDQLPQDIMHVLFEGVVPLELRLLLHELMRKDTLISTF